MMVSNISKLIAGQINKKYGKPYNFLKRGKSPSTFNNLSEDEKNITECAEKCLKAQLKILPPLLEDMAEVIFPPNLIKTKKANLLNFAKSTDNRTLYKKISNTTTAKELFNICVNYNQKLLGNGENGAKDILRTNFNGKFTLDIEQAIYSLRQERSKKMLGLYEAITTKSTKPEVIKIENILKQQFGMKKVNLQDDLTVGQDLLHIVKKLKQKGYPIPDNALVSDIHPSTGENLELGGERTILLQSTACQNLCSKVLQSEEFGAGLFAECNSYTLHTIANFFSEMIGKGVEELSTADPYHVIAHECLHSNHPHLVSFMFGKVPAKFKPTIENISLYTNLNKNKAEILTELETKLFLTGKLTEDETKLYKQIKNETR